MKNKAKIIISIALLLLGLFLAISNLYLLDGSFSVINFSQSRSQLSGFEDGLLLKGERVAGNFTANGNWLGGLSFRFDNRKNMSTDSIVFRLNEEISNQLIYQATYKVDQFQPNKLFPFGFPIIPDSKNKKYHFEIESLNGSTDNAIALSPISPIFSIKYQYSIESLRSSRFPVEFIYLKLLSLFTDRQFMLSLFIFMSPLIIFGVYFSPLRLKKKKLFLLWLPIIFIATSLFFENKLTVFTSLILIANWLLITIMCKLESQSAVLPALLFLFLTIISVLLNQEDLAGKAIMWTYLFIILTITHSLVEIYLKPKITVK